MRNERVQVTDSTGCVHYTDPHMALLISETSGGYSSETAEDRLFDTLQSKYFAEYILAGHDVDTAQDMSNDKACDEAYT